MYKVDCRISSTINMRSLDDLGIDELLHVVDALLLRTEETVEVLGLVLQLLRAVLDLADPAAVTALSHLSHLLSQCRSLASGWSRPLRRTPEVNPDGAPAVSGTIFSTLRSALCPHVRP